MNTEELEQMAKFMELKASKSKKSPLKGVAKKLSIWIIAITFSVGIVGSFEIVPFSMDDFVKFLPVFGILFVPLIFSIGAKSITDKVIEKNGK